MEYTFFDGLIDSVFVIGPGREVYYCNESAAKLCQSSVRRLARGKPIYDTIEFSDKNLFVMPEGTTGENEPAPYQEIEFKLKSAAKSGKVQVAIQPFSESSGEKRWVVMIRDVTIEEVLHAKYQKQLENLEQLVEERTGEVKRANVMLNAIMNSLGQGFFAFDQNGDCLDFYTRACRDILEVAPEGRKVWEVLKLNEKEKSTFAMWMKAVFSETLPFESLRELGPGQFHHSQGRRVQLEYFPIRNDAGAIQNIVVVATDRTSEFLANEALEREKKYAHMIIKLVTNRRQFSQFLKGVTKTLDKISVVDFSDEGRAELYRVLHTLEGEAGIYSVQELWLGARKCQEVLQTKNVGLFQESIESLREQYAHFISNNRDLFEKLGVFDGGSQVELSRGEVEQLLGQFKKMGLEGRFYEILVERLEKEPISRLLSHYELAVQTLATKLDKKLAPLKIVGGERRIFAEPYRNLISSFIHLFRNCVDHGIESPDMRKSAGKSEEGHIEIRIESFEHGNNEPWLRIRVTDDGQGIPAEVLPRVFNPGFSTRQEVGEFSGRGVGMNVIAVEAEALGGHARIESEVGKGTSVTVEVPDLRQVVHQKVAA